MRHRASGIRELEDRARALRDERGGLDPDSLARETTPIRERLEEMERELAMAEAGQSRAHDAVRRLRDAVHASEKALHDARELLGQHRGRVASLDALQREALGAGAGALAEWLEARGFADAPRLAQAMRVAPGWEHAVEAVLGARLQAVRADAFETVVADASETLGQGTFTAVDASLPDRTPAGGAGGLGTLRSKVETPWPVADLLEGVFCAADLDEALGTRSRLAPGESVITAQGVWIGPTWMHVRRGGAGEYGVLERERALAALAREIDRASEDESARARAVHDLSGELRVAEEAYARAQRSYNEDHRRCTALRSELAARTAEAERTSRRSAELDAELSDIVSRIEAEREELSAAGTRLERSSGELSRLSAERARCENWRGAQREHLARSRERWRALRDEVHALELRVEGMRMRLRASEEAGEREQRRLEELEERREALRGAFEETEAPLAEAAAVLEEKLARRASLESVMRSARADVEHVEAEVRATDEERQRQAAEVQRERETLERLRVESQETLVLRKTVEERLEAAGQVLESLLDRIADDAGVDAWAEKLAAMERRIARLGPINLAAIEEHEQQAERKRYLDAQHADLEEALATLDTAIQKIDRETRTRFRETYERINDGLGTMFPRLFGGGNAELQLTSEDLLGAGVTVMARPAGQAQREHPPAVGRREGAHRDSARVCDLRAESGAVLSARRGRRATRRRQHRAVPRARARDGEARPARACDAQQDYDGDCRTAHRHYHERAGCIPSRRGGRRGGGGNGAGMSRCAALRRRDDATMRRRDDAARPCRANAGAMAGGGILEHMTSRGREGWTIYASHC